jgi:hypothetical protein
MNITGDGRKNAGGGRNDVGEEGVMLEEEVGRSLRGLSNLAG